MGTSLGERRRHRSWPEALKREIVAASLQPGVRPSEIIQRHGITSGQLYAWRQQLTRRISGELAPSAPRFVRVAVETDVRQVLMIREVIFPTLQYDVLARLPLRGTARAQAAAG